MSDVYIWKTCGRFTIVCSPSLRSCFWFVFYIFCVLFVVRINNPKGLRLKQIGRNTLDTHIWNFNHLALTLAQIQFQDIAFICRNRSAFSSSYQKHWYAIPIGHHKVMIKHFSKFIVESRASFLNEFLTLYQEEASKTREKERQMDWERRRYGLCTGWEASVLQNLRLIFDCIFVTLAINALRDALWHIPICSLNLSLVNWFYLCTLCLYWSLQKFLPTIISFSACIAHSFHSNY